METETRARVVYANEFAVTTRGIHEYEKVIDPIVCKSMDRGFDAKRGTGKTPGYICKVLINTDEYWLTVSAKKGMVATYEEEEVMFYAKRSAEDSWDCFGFYSSIPEYRSVSVFRSMDLDGCAHL